MTQLPKTADEIDESQPDASEQTWEADQKARGYYYDDACGYETYDPDAEAEDPTSDDEQ
ncbi:MAG: hypothetical protein K1X36_02180 [Pyrinomonadaceae bacterium]|nr:hypothetical protein [Pyrinomonadaceae bacterium]